MIRRMRVFALGTAAVLSASVGAVLFVSPAAPASPPPPPAPVAATGLVSDGYGNCALLRSGGARCWGDNSFGELGDGGYELSSNVPVAVKGLIGAVSLVADGVGYCALLRSRAAVCWGNNADGGLGDGGAERASNVPVAVQGLLGAISLVSDGAGSCALLANGGAECWGNNFFGGLGSGGTERSSNVPVAVKGLAGAVGLVGGGDGYGYCALVANGGAECWGNDYLGGLGNGGTERSSNVPVRVKGLSDAASLVSEGDGYCALLRSGAAKCWGNNTGDDLGNGGTERSSNVPVTVKGLLGAASLVSDGSGSCALLTSGGARCWGNDEGNLLGDGKSVRSSAVPVTVAGLVGAASLVSDGVNYCAVLHSGEAECWGNNAGGGLGNGGTEKSSNVTVMVKGLTGVASLENAGSGYGNCALLANGGAECWGDNYLGGLGNGGNEASSNVPVPVRGLGS